MKQQLQTHIPVFITLLCVMLAIWYRSQVLSLLFFVRALIYEQPGWVLFLSGLYLGTMLLLSLRIRRTMPVMLSILILGMVVVNVFASYQEVLKFGITQGVFTDLLRIFIHSSLVPLAFLTADIGVPVALGVLGICLIMLKGYVVVRKWISGSLAEKIMLSAAFGCGITAFSMYVLAAFQVLSLKNILIIDGAFFSAVILLPTHTFHLPAVTFHISRREKQVYLFLTVLLCCGLFYTLLVPPLEWDSLAYQAYYSRLIFDTEGLPLIFGPSIGIEMSAAYPPAYQMLGSYLYFFMGTANAQFMSLLSYISGILSLCAVFFFSTLLLPSHRLYAVVATMAVPFFMAFSASPHYMALLIFFNALFVYYLSHYILAKNQCVLLLAVIFLGFACLTSYLALASFLFLVIVWIKTRFNIGYAFIPVAILSPVLVRNLYYTGNPLFPLFGIGHQLQNFLWLSNTAHFETQTMYAGLDLTSPFSVLDFFVNRISSIRPLIPLILITGLVLLLVHRPKEEREKWLIMLFLASILIFLVRPTFDRYLLVYIPIYAVVFAWIFSKAEEMKSIFLQRSLQVALVGSLGIVVVGMTITGPLIMASHVKQFPDQPLDQWAYVRQFYPHDTPCWKWLNEHTSPDTSIATYDIRYYYIDGEIFALDGLDAIPLYDMSPDEAITFLKENNVQYWFSSRWTSPADETCPPAYFDNPLTPYLGSDILPLVFLSGQSAIYGIGPQEVDYQTLLEHERMLYPVQGMTYQFKEGKMVYFDISGDLQDKTIILHFSVPLQVGLYSGHAVSSSLLGEVIMEEQEVNRIIIPCISGKYTLYIVSDESFSVIVEII